MKNYHHETALIMAINTKQPIFISLLLSYGTRTNVRDSAGNSPGELAAQTENPWVALALNNRRGLPRPKYNHRSMVNRLIMNPFVHSYSFTHTHDKPHLEYINTVWHPKVTVKNKQGANPLEALLHPEQ